ncbi:carboxymuconolactone decarboxylase family protein [Actinokineospora sp. NPDC004072]
MEKIMQRMNVAAVAPEAYRAMLALEKYLAASPLPKSTFELVKLRASQINGCAYCVDMHSHDAKAGGETDERLYAVAVWREAPFFTPAERAALAFTEAATRLADHGRGVPQEVWDEAAEHFDEQTMAALVVAVSTINAWNRIAVSTGAVAGSHRK